MKDILEIRIPAHRAARRKALHFFISLLLLAGLVAGLCIHASKGYQLGELKDIRDYHKTNTDRVATKKKGICDMPGCDNEMIDSISYTFSNKDQSAVTVEIPNAANFTISGSGYVSKDKFVSVDKEDVYIVSHQGNGNYVVSKDEIRTTEVYETNHMQMHTLDISGKYCNDHLVEAATILVDEIEASFNRDIIYFLCMYLAPYNILALPALIALLYWLIRELPNDRLRAKSIKRGSVYANESAIKESSKKSARDFKVITPVCIALFGLAFLVGLLGDSVFCLTIQTFLCIFGSGFSCRAISDFGEMIGHRMWLSAARSYAKSK